MENSVGVFGGSIQVLQMVKWIERIEFVESEKLIGDGEGGPNEDEEYFDLLPKI
jgi:hypothetical protein